MGSTHHLALSTPADRNFQIVYQNPPSNGGTQDTGPTEALDQEGLWDSIRLLGWAIFLHTAHRARPSLSTTHFTREIVSLNISCLCSSYSTRCVTLGQSQELPGSRFTPTPRVCVEAQML